MDNYRFISRWMDGDDLIIKVDDEQGKERQFIVKDERLIYKFKNMSAYDYFDKSELFYCKERIIEKMGLSQWKDLIKNERERKNQ